MRENKQMICDAICLALLCTANAGRTSGNGLAELRYIQKEDGTEIVRPILEDGTGENGYYDINVTMDSGTAMFLDIANQFIGKVW